VGAHASATSSFRPVTDRPGVVDEALLREPADHGLRVVALSLIQEGLKAADQLRTAPDGLVDGTQECNEALHDFRVALRRLRSWIRAFKPWLRESVRRKHRRRLREIAHATSATRDAAVHLEWLDGERSGMSAEHRVGQAWLRARVESARKEGAADALSAVTDFDSLAATLSRRLGVYTAHVLTHERPAPFGAVISEQILTESRALRERLAAVREFTDADTAHRARIAAKRLRYVIEPVAGLDINGDAIVEILKALQHQLGDLHDVHVFAEDVGRVAGEAAASQARDTALQVPGKRRSSRGSRPTRARDPGPGVLRIARRLNQRGVQAYKSVERDWLNDAGLPFFDRVHEFAAAILESAATSRVQS
jgi:CHAD domain-containing protein